MAKQFPVKRFARGVKLTTQHVSDPLTSIKTEAGEANLQDTVEHTARTKVSWVMPYAGPGTADKTTNISTFMWPFTAPPFQQLFNWQDQNSDTLVDPQYQLTISEISLSIDQRAEPQAIAGYGAVGLNVGDIAFDVDMSRYSMTLRLLERQPSLISFDIEKYEEIGKWEIDGVNAYGVQQSAAGGTAGKGVPRGNPLVIPDQNLAIRPWNTYFWELTCAGLNPVDLPGTKDTWTFTLGGTLGVGDICRLQIQGNTYDYTINFFDTLITVAAGLALAAAADPLYTVSAVGNVITATEITASSDNNVLNCSFIIVSTTGTETVFTDHTKVGVAGTNYPPIELVSVHLCATLESALTVRDKATDFDAASKPIQNLPTVHGGAKTGTYIPFVPPVSNDLITGNDVQSEYHGFDRALRNRAESGYGTGYGPLAKPLEASAPPPEEMLANDAHYSMIMVPMWGGQYRESVRAVNAPNANLPYVDFAHVGGNKITEDVFVLPVPEGFVLHHAFVVWNGYSPESKVYVEPGNGTWPTHALYQQEVGVVLNTGWRSDDYLHQQVAYLRWNGAALPNADSYKNWLLDEYNPNSEAGWRILQIPLVNNRDSWLDHSWFSSGPPFYMGKANTLTEARANCGTMPTYYPGCVAFAPPATGGKENVLEIRWTKDLSAYEDMEQTDTIIGQGGEWVILCGKQVLTA